MEIIFTQAELNPILEKFVPRKPQLYFTGTNTFDVNVEIKFGFRKTISCRIDYFSERSITVSYELNAIFNQFVKWINKELPEGIFWDKVHQKFHIDPLIILSKKLKKLPIEADIKDFSIKDGKLKIEFSPVFID